MSKLKDALIQYKLFDENSLNSSKKPHLTVKNLKSSVQEWVLLNHVHKYSMTSCTLKLLEHDR